MEGGGAEAAVWCSGVGRRGSSAGQASKYEAGECAEPLVVGAWRARPLKAHQRRPSSPSLPIVIVPGFLAGCPWYFLQLSGLAREGHEVWVFDALGSGLSSRPKRYFSMGALESHEGAEERLVDDLRRCLDAAGLRRFILSGHSLGGWIAVNFALRHPERVAHLAPMASAGVPPAPEQLGELLGTWKGRFFDHIWKTGSPGAFMRFFGPMGPSMAGAYVRRRLLARNISDDERQALRDYMFQSTAAPSSFDEVVPSVFALGAWAHRPYGPRLGALQCGITWIYGDRDWMRHEHASFALENTVPPEFRVASAVRVLKGAAHNVQVDAWQEVNVILGEIARKHTV